MSKTRKYYNRTMGKTKKCSYCEKRKDKESMYNISICSYAKFSKETWICNECNLKEDVI